MTPSLQKLAGPKYIRQRGMTLAELLVVLVILAILATVAVQALAPVAEQTRFDATKRTLDNVRTAIVGDGGSSAISGFVADTGRLPTSLDELLVQPSDLSLFGLQAAPDPHGDILVTRGWRGPYVRPPVGTTIPQLLDGWGVPLSFANPSAGELLISSPAATRPTNTPGYTNDLIVHLQATDSQAALITGSLYRLNGQDDNHRIPPSTLAGWFVDLIGPGPITTNSGVMVQTATASLDAATGELRYSFSVVSGHDLSIGPRVLRARNNSVAKGFPVYLVVRPGATHITHMHVE